MQNLDFTKAAEAIAQSRQEVIDKKSGTEQEQTKEETEITAEQLEQELRSKEKTIKTLEASGRIREFLHKENLDVGFAQDLIKTFDALAIDSKEVIILETIKKIIDSVRNKEQS